MSDSELSRTLTPARRLMIMVAVILGSTLYSTTLLIASTLLPQMQGTMGATSDEIAWAMTFNILATAVVTPMTGWLVARFGRRQVMTTSILGFTISTWASGASDSLEMLVFWRILQGGIGAPMIPLSQAVLLDSFPRRHAGMVTSVFGMAVVIGPVIGPTLGGFLAETYSWRWAFYMLVPVGFTAWAGLRATLPRDTASGQTRLDWTGFLTLSAAISCVQLVLARGQRLDWFESTEIVAETVLACVALFMFVAHTLTAERPFLNPKLLSDPNYALGLVLVTIYGMLNFTPVVLLPTLLQQHAGYPDQIIGGILGARGIGATVGFFLAMFVGKIDPRIGMSLGFGLMAAGGFWLMNLDLNVDMMTLALISVLQGVGIGVFWVPLTISTFATLETRLMPEAMALFHLSRNIGSSFFISVCVAEIVRATGANYSRLTEMISPFNKSLDLPWVMGSWTMETPVGLARLAKEINRQAAMIGYVNAFTYYTATSVVAILLIMLARRRTRKVAG
ncbi:MAG: DHA2 family efflux MFS transporter permease subunit [Acetobacteraceae bacterium]|nr:DHA2 family efflux MFS transporter permease subunit [Acetobacteraceae bacterium]